MLRALEIQVSARGCGDTQRFNILPFVGWVTDASGGRVLGRLRTALCPCGSPSWHDHGPDGIFDDCPPGESVYLKIDTQGYEGRVLRGASRSLATIDVTQLELPLVPLYVDENSFSERLELKFAEGFALIGLDCGFTAARTGHVSGWTPSSQAAFSVVRLLVRSNPSR